MTIEINKEKIYFGQVKRDKSKTESFTINTVSGINYVITAPEGYWLVDPITSALVKKIDIADNEYLLITNDDDFIVTNDDEAIIVVT